MKCEPKYKKKTLDLEGQATFGGLKTKLTRSFLLQAEYSYTPALSMAANMLTAPEETSCCAKHTCSMEVEEQKSSCKSVYTTFAYTQAL